MSINFEQLKIKLLDINPIMVEEWHKSFDPLLEDYYPNVEIIHSSLNEYMQGNKNSVAAIVSPANSFGLMDGGFDAAIRNWYLLEFDTDIIPIVQGEIAYKYYGEQPVGTSLPVFIPGTGSYILHTPTMWRPEVIDDYMTIYHCTRSAIITAMNAELDTIVIPAFGGCCGKVPFSVIADLMERALMTFISFPSNKNYNWHWVNKGHPLNEIIVEENQ